MQEYLKYGENDYYPPLPNGHRLFLHDIRRVAVRAAVAMGEEGDVVVSFEASFYIASYNMEMSLVNMMQKSFNWKHFATWYCFWKNWTI